MRVMTVEYFKDHKLKIRFDDNKTKIVDIDPIIKKSKGLFKPLQDIDYFKKVTLDDDEYPLSIRWPNDADICPDILYELGTEIPTDLKKAPTRKKTSPPSKRPATLQRFKKKS